ncbi:hypothetical protein [Peribacillus frigoritolerans]|uniref:hypothetical protein n=1 Tax=Peribacillus frigoritolerans TaxID=450367 RepID=UPI001F4FEF26|nr:hypothetical protein [Peribacillus frigoritolerans]MCK2020681.1 hypothetical protein [Peribacillus frigoritolerans]
MEFRTKDLMIRIVAAGNDDINHGGGAHQGFESRGCGGCTRCSGCSSCSSCSSCTGHTRCGISIFLTERINNPDEFSLLKADLKQALESVELQEKILTSQKIELKSIEEAEAMENRLSALLEEVRQQKGLLQPNSQTTDT